MSIYVLEHARWWPLEIAVSAYQEAILLWSAQAAKCVRWDCHMMMSSMVGRPTAGLWVLKTLCPCGGGRARFGSLLSGSGCPASPELSPGPHALCLAHLHNPDAEHPPASEVLGYIWTTVYLQDCPRARCPGQGNT